MRIIAGLAKGMNILSPEGMDTRPTLDRIKESIFNIIQNRVQDSIVIDVFAGTGSLGLEAASRGAKECYLIDKGKVTFPLLKKNIQNLKFQGNCKCFNMDSYKILKDFGQRGLVFDLIFIDPPYCKNMISPAIKIIHEYSMLSKDGIIVSKIDSSEIIYEGNEEIVLTDFRKYGNTTVCFYRYREE